MGIWDGTSLEKMGTSIIISLANIKIHYLMFCLSACAQGYKVILGILSCTARQLFCCIFKNVYDRQFLFTPLQNSKIILIFIYFWLAYVILFESENYLSRRTGKKPTIVHFSLQCMQCILMQDQVLNG
jgi:hypothetical protein